MLLLLVRLSHTTPLPRYFPDRLLVGGVGLLLGVYKVGLLDFISWKGIRWRQYATTRRGRSLALAQYDNCSYPWYVDLKNCTDLAGFMTCMYAGGLVSFLVKSGFFSETPNPPSSLEYLYRLHLFFRKIFIYFVASFSLKERLLIFTSASPWSQMKKTSLSTYNHFLDPICLHFHLLYTPDIITHLRLLTRVLRPWSRRPQYEWPRRAELWARIRADAQK